MLPKPYPLTKVKYSLSTGEPITLQGGIPESYQGPSIRGAYCFYALQDFGYIVIQEVKKNQYLFRHVAIKWKYPVSILCEHEYRVVLFARISLDTSVFELTKGTAITELPPNHFALFTGENWTTLIHSEEKGTTTFIEMAWAPEFVKEITKDHQEIMAGLRNTVPGVANKIVGPPYKANLELRIELGDLDFHFPDFSDDLMKKICGSMIKEIIHLSWMNEGINREEYATVNAVRNKIKNNLFVKYSDEELAHAFQINATKLKKLYKTVFGASLEESRKYMLCIWARDQIIFNDTQLSRLAASLGFQKQFNFTEACKRHIACMPGEIKRKKWNPDMRPKIIGQRLYLTIKSLLYWL